MSPSSVSIQFHPLVTSYHFKSERSFYITKILCKFLFDPI